MGQLSEALTKFDKGWVGLNWYNKLTAEWQITYTNDMLSVSRIKSLIVSKVYNFVPHLNAYSLDNVQTVDWIWTGTIKVCTEMTK